MIGAIQVWWTEQYQNVVVFRQLEDVNNVYPEPIKHVYRALIVASAMFLDDSRGFKF